MQKHLIVIDLDGTTLSEDKTINSITSESIKKVTEEGHEVVIATGRPFYSSSEYYDHLELKTVLVNRNGAYVHKPNSDDFKELHFGIEKGVIEKIIDSEIYQYIDHFYIESKKDFYILKGNMDFFSTKNYHFSNVIEDFDHTVFSDITMAIIFVHNDKVDQVKEYLNKFNNLYCGFWSHSGEYPNTMIEIFPHEVDKVKALETLSEFYNIPNDRIIAIGDQVNDIQMIKSAGVGVAVSNAIDEVKEVADVVLEYSNDEGAVGLFLKEYLNVK